MSFIIKEKTDRENPVYYSDSGWPENPFEATQLDTLQEAMEIRDGLYQEDDWDGETRYEIVDLSKREAK
jgi:hypothetical protein